MKCPKCGTDLDFDLKLKGTADWRKEPATQEQLHELKRIGVQHTEHISKGEASDLLDFYKKEQFRR